MSKPKSIIVKVGNKVIGELSPKQVTLCRTNEKKSKNIQDIVDMSKDPRWIAFVESQGAGGQTATE
jgi:hypothetical protein